MMNWKGFGRKPHMYHSVPPFIWTNGEPGKSLFKRASSGKYSSGNLRSFISETKIIHNWSCRKSGRFRTVSYTPRKPVIFTPPKKGKHTYCIV
jgi:hypothetical protein